jgi:hypothetical protein
MVTDLARDCDDTQLCRAQTLTSHRIAAVSERTLHKNGGIGTTPAVVVTLGLHHYFADNSVKSQIREHMKHMLSRERVRHSVTLICIDVRCGIAMVTVQHSHWNRNATRPFSQGPLMKCQTQMLVLFYPHE